MWTKYPRQMLRARVISEGIRATNPAVATGMYTPEEVQDMEPVRKEKVINPRKEEKTEVKPVMLTPPQLKKALQEFAEKGIDEQKIRANIGHDQPWTREEMNTAWDTLTAAI